MSTVLHEYRSTTHVDVLSRIEAFRPLWLTITDEIPGFKFLTDAFNSNEKTPQYCDAVSRALDIPTCKVVPFFGTFLKDLRSILSTVPSIVVLCNRNTQKPIEVCARQRVERTTFLHARASFLFLF